MLYISIIAKTIERRKICQKIIITDHLLAQKLQCEFCAKLIDFTENIIFSKDFLENHRQSANDFTRTRKLPFPKIVLFLSNLLKGSYQDELDGFTKAAGNCENYERDVTDAAFCKARRKVRYDAFIHLNRETASFFYENFTHKTWNGFNLAAVDGSTLKLPESDEIAQHFGCLNPKEGEPVPMAGISQMSDVLSRVTPDAVIAPQKDGERELPARHILNLMPDDLFLLDRGYPSFPIFRLILSQGGSFCARIPHTLWKKTKSFFNSGKKDQITTIRPSPHAVKTRLEMGLDISPLKLRPVRVGLNSGSTEILIASLLDRKKYPVEIFSDLYHERWCVEEDYKTMKCRVEAGRFSGFSVLSVYQDFHAEVFSKNLTAITANTVSDQIDGRYSQRKYPYQINFTQALSKMKDSLVTLFLEQEKLC